MADVEGVVEERNLRVTTTGLADLDACLTWVVRTYDRDFARATMVNIGIGQYLSSDGTGPQRPLWTAWLDGLVEEKKMTEEAV